MRTLYLDCFAGASGDMFIGAMLDLGLEPARLLAELDKLGLGGYRIEIEKVNRSGIQASRFKVMLDGPAGEALADSEVSEVPAAQADATPEPDQAHSHPHEHAHPHEHDHADDHPHEHDHPHDHPHEHDHAHPHPAHGHAGGRPLGEIQALIAASPLSQATRARAAAIFQRLGEAESRVHGTPLQSVHFHELGSLDAILDIVGAAAAVELLGIQRVIVSPLHLGSGFVRIQHGLYPVPAPATAFLLEGAPAYTSQVPGELVTPTGAAILTTLADEYGPMPVMAVERVGYGAGTRQRQIPNVLRAVLGQAGGEAPGGRASRDPHPEQHAVEEGSGGYHAGPATVIEASIDDMNPQLVENLLERLLEAGALDAWVAPVQMKKNRPGILLHVLAHPDTEAALLPLIFRETTTIGARSYPVTKHMLRREVIQVQTPYGPARVKLSRLGGQVVTAAPEYEDCRRLARQSGAALKEVIAAAQAAARLA
jgi:hypothetical protein